MQLYHKYANLYRADVHFNFGEKMKKMLKTKAGKVIRALSVTEIRDELLVLSRTIKEPIIITNRNKPAMVLVPINQWEKVEK